MKKIVKLSFILVFLQVFTAYAAAENFQSFNVEGMLETSKMKDSLNNYLATMRELNPEKYTKLGFTGVEHKLTPRSQENITERTQVAKKHLSELKKIKHKVLGRNDYYDYLLFRSHLETEIYELQNYNPLKNPFHYLETLPAVYQLIYKNTATHYKKLESAFFRLGQIPRILKQAQKYLETPPKIWVVNAILQCKYGQKSLDKLTPFFAELTSMDLTTSENVYYSIESAKQALKEYEEFLESRISPVSTGDFAVGKKAYDYMLEHKFITDWSYKEVLKQTEKKFYEVRENFLADLASFAGKQEVKLESYEDILLDFGKNHPRSEGLLTAFADEIQNAYGHFRRNLNLKSPVESIKIIQTPDFFKPFAGFAEYNPPYGADDDKNAELYINLPPAELKTSVKEVMMRKNFNYPYIKLAVVGLVMPGKFYYDVNSKNVSKFKRIFTSPTVANGWSDYAFTLALQSDYLLKKEEKLALLRWKLVTSARAYIDVALHTGELDYTSASKFLMQEAGFSKKQAESEILKISLDPAMAPTYVMGEAEIGNFSKKFTKTENFHKAFFRAVGVPMSDLKQALENWETETSLLK